MLPRSRQKEGHAQRHHERAWGRACHRFLGETDTDYHDLVFRDDHRYPRRVLKGTIPNVRFMQTHNMLVDKNGPAKPGRASFASPNTNWEKGGKPQPAPPLYQFDVRADRERITMIPDFKGHHFVEDSTPREQPSAHHCEHCGMEALLRPGHWFSLTASASGSLFRSAAGASFAQNDKLRRSKMESQIRTQDR